MGGACAQILPRTRNDYFSRFSASITPKFLLNGVQHRQKSARKFL
jgi:hypothetical protein